MTALVKNLLVSFDALSDADKHEAVIEILRRFRNSGYGDLPEDALAGLADELFRNLDEAEADTGRR